MKQLGKLPGLASPANDGPRRYWLELVSKKSNVYGLADFASKRMGCAGVPPMRIEYARDDCRWHPSAVAGAIRRRKRTGGRRERIDQRLEAQTFYALQRYAAHRKRPRVYKATTPTLFRVMRAAHELWDVSERAAYERIAELRGIRVEAAGEDDLDEHDPWMILGWLRPAKRPG